MTAQKDSAGTGEDITLKGVSKTFATASGPLPVLRDIDLHIKAGEFVSFVGPSGCGKSTLLNIIAGLVRHDSGTVTVGGKPPREGRDDIGFMLQKSVLMPWLNVTKNVELPFVISRRRGPKTAGRIAELLALVGLSDYATLNAWELSGGMQQRVALARALALDPKVMLMDEPFSALDEFKREHLNIEVADMSDRFGQTTILVTHSISEAVLMSDRIIALGANPGRIVGDIAVDLPRPRNPDMVGSDPFQKISNEVRAALLGKVEAN
ncbi:MAG: ABC transporter ATP-binding protein [Maritimibacter sp.]|nr:ABC transporter ATP-binding protein [Maritimibacter sp.]